MTEVLQESHAWSSQVEAQIESYSVKVPMSSASLLSQSRKTAAASTINFEHQLSENLDARDTTRARRAVTVGVEEPKQY